MGRRSLLAAALAGALAVGGAAFAAPAAFAALPSNCTQAGRTVTCSYASTGAEQTFTVPTGVTSVQVTAIGGAGGSLNRDLSGAPGRGAIVTGALSNLNSGSTLYVEVGGSVDDSDNFTFAQPGFNGGGGGQDDLGQFGNAGGGASDVRTSPRTAADTLDTRLIVAGGGGGAGVRANGAVDPAGSNAGGDAGSAGGTQTARDESAGGGGAGTAVAGGAAGTASEQGRAAKPGNPGSKGQGGDAVPGNARGASGAGGGGLFGGGSGGAADDVGGGGGGGSSLVPTGGTVSVSSAAPSVTISYMVPSAAGAITATSGSGQSAQVGRAFTAPLVATVTDPTDNSPVAGAPVTYTVTSGSASFPGGTTATATTGANGQATSPTLTAGSAAGPVTVTATTPGVTGAATFTETVTAAPVATAVTVKGGGTLSATDGQRYSIAVDAQATAAGQASGRFALSGGGADTTVGSRAVTAVRKTATGATVSGTAVNSRGQTVTFTLTVVDKPGGRDLVTVQLGGKTVSGTLTNGDIVTS